MMPQGIVFKKALYHLNVDNPGSWSLNYHS